MAPVAVSETHHLDGKRVLSENTLVDPFYSPAIADDGDDKYKYAEFKVSLSMIQEKCSRLNCTLTLALIPQHIMGALSRSTSS